MSNIAKIIDASVRDTAFKLGIIGEGRTVKYAKFFSEYIMKDSLVLDVGCGTGPFSVVCAKVGAMVISTDIDLVLLKKIPLIL